MKLSNARSHHPARNARARMRGSIAKSGEEGGLRVLALFRET